ncbi:MAG: substrate-binding domain-containing protein [Alphaproteobacteria bacterium GM202ARS2]|nr:substrate-binding domain-containing protein [Alphaproteobacteria bacterium GM202ARS2]
MLRFFLSPRLAPIVVLCGALLAFLVLNPSTEENDSLILVATTSTDNSGLLEFLLPHFEDKYAINVRVLTTGSGQALNIGRNGDADVLLVHDPHAEQQFVRAGHARFHHAIMHNDFILVGPRHDPCAIKGASNLRQAMTLFLASCAPFISRGDNSGTHTKEKELWHNATITNHEAQPWYRQSGSGMGATLNIAASLDAYTLSDRATFTSFMNKQNLVVLYQKDPHLDNVYSLILPKKHRHSTTTPAQQLAQWLTSPEGKDTINAFTIHNQQVFFATP